MHVLIAGGGLAGSVAAMALHRAGVEATVFEPHAPSEREVGSVFTIAPNGLDALEAVGALPLVRADGHPTRRNVLWDTNGRRLGVAGLGRPLPDGTVAHTIRRARLTRRLLEEVQARGIRAVFGPGGRLADARPDGSGRVVATFADGSSATGDLLVGADGIHSVVRRLLDPAAPDGRFVGLTNFGGLTRGAHLDVEPEAWHMVFGRRAFFGFFAAPNGDAIWFVNWPRGPISPAERAATSEEAWKRHLAELFSRDAGPARDLIRDGELELAGDNTFDLGHVPVWRRGPVVIIGDAAHAPAPTSGQGASMAAEDGVILAKALRDSRSVAEALATYERARRERVEKIVAWGARGSSAKIPGGVGRVLRDAMLRVAFRWFVTDRAMAWQFDHRVDWDRPLAPGGQGRVALGAA